ncbi:MAG: hypothetical protein NTX50_25710 [Candidatus Sumerlaeota bacterium]|nr:hypothetical protein [Candidatus Sumerlaeota bacterium]
MLGIMEYGKESVGRASPLHIRLPGICARRCIENRAFPAAIRPGQHTDWKRKIETQILDPAQTFDADVLQIIGHLALFGAQTIPYLIEKDF